MSNSSCCRNEFTVFFFCVNLRAPVRDIPDEGNTDVHHLSAAHTDENHCTAFMLKKDDRSCRLRLSSSNLQTHTLYHAAFPLGK